MLITIDTEQRNFHVIKMGFGNKSVCCNLGNIPDLLRNEFEKNDQIKVKQFWDSKWETVTKKQLNGMFSANQIDYKIK